VITVLGRATIALHKIRDVTDCVKTVPSIDFQIQACFHKIKMFKNIWLVSPISRLISFKIK